VQLHLGGHLSWYDPLKRSELTIQLPEPIRLIALLEELGVPATEVAISVLNGSAMPQEEINIVDGDRVELYPPVGGG
jgi:sulfur carrier protein ThiS